MQSRYSRYDNTTRPKTPPKPSFFEQAKMVLRRTAAQARYVGPQAMGSSVAVTAVLYTTGVLSASVCLPVCVGMIIGLLPIHMISGYLGERYCHSDIFMGIPRAEKMFEFLLRASTELLGILIGLAIASMLVTLTMNPFTTSALIAGGVSATFILGLYLYLNHKIKQAIKHDNSDCNANPNDSSSHDNGHFGSSNNNNVMHSVYEYDTQMFPSNNNNVSRTSSVDEQYYVNNCTRVRLGNCGSDSN